MALQQELYLRDDLQQLWQGQDAFAAARAVSGTIFRKLEQRQTLAFSHSSRCYFIKRHRGVTWKEIFKNLLQLRMPVVSAHNEFQAARHQGALCCCLWASWLVSRYVRIIPGHRRRG